VASPKAFSQPRLAALGMLVSHSPGPWRGADRERGLIVRPDRSPGLVEKTTGWHGVIVAWRGAFRKEPTSPRKFRGRGALYLPPSPWEGALKLRRSPTFTPKLPSG